MLYIELLHIRLGLFREFRVRPADCIVIGLDKTVGLRYQLEAVVVIAVVVGGVFYRRFLAYGVEVALLMQERGAYLFRGTAYGVSGYVEFVLRAFML